jgi:hypothetical protein
VFATSFDSGSHDDCGFDKVMVRRMDDAINCNGTTGPAGEFYDHIPFCCSDIANNNIMVVLRGWDKAGNYNDCMIEVEVMDVVPPVINCPIDLCIECDFPFDIENMASVFGTVVEGQFNIGTHTIGGSNGGYYNRQENECSTHQTIITFQDGWAHDNCNITITSTYVDQRSTCGSGNIVRTFTAADPNGSVQCTQIINFRDTNPFAEDDITWPAPYTFTGCENPDNYTPDITGYPILNERPCHVVGSSYEDDVIRYNVDEDYDGDVCFTILRKWTVLDMCPENQDPLRKWVQEQRIDVQENEKPYFTTACEAKEVCTYDTTCVEGFIELTMSAADNCTAPQNMKWRYQIDLHNNGIFDTDSKNFPYPNNIISGPSADASGDYPIGNHRILWTTWDQCGNKQVCEQFFAIKNCLQPTPVCVDNIIVVLMPMDLNNDGVIDTALITIQPQICEGCCDNSFHPCGYPLKYSFSSDTTDVERTYGCVGKIPVQMWVTAILPDGSITQDFCTTSIDFQDNSGVCGYPAPLPADVSGTVTTIFEQPIPEVEIMVYGSELGLQKTGADGKFAFPLEIKRHYDVLPGKSGDDLLGISTLDLVLIQKHILSITGIGNPYFQLAADINGDSRISAADILLLRRLILGQSDQLDRSWMFVPADYSFINPDNPFAEQAPSSVAIYPVADMSIDFYGIKIGDVNGSANLIEARSDEAVSLLIDDAMLNRGVEVEIPVYANNFIQVFGGQIAIDLSGIDIKKIIPGRMNITDANYNIVNGRLLMSFNDANGIDADDGSELFTLIALPSMDANLSDMINVNDRILRSEIYTGKELKIRKMGIEFRNHEFALYQNQPNPFTTVTEIGFKLPVPGSYDLRIVDVAGREVYSTRGIGSRGYNSITVKNDDLPGDGVYFYVLRSGDNTATRKMIIYR